eukprot:2901575-Prymnesium_polylepis.2
MAAANVSPEPPSLPEGDTAQDHAGGDGVFLRQEDDLGYLPPDRNTPIYVLRGCIHAGQRSAHMASQPKVCDTKDKQQQQQAQREEHKEVEEALGGVPKAIDSARVVAKIARLNE